jgi:hypothetical protein
MKFLFSLLAIEVILVSSLYGIIWTETSFQDFNDGEVGPGLYVSHRTMLEPDSGCIEYSARFDANNDGYFDLTTSYFGAGNDYIRLYLGGIGGFNKDSVVLFPIPISGGNCCFADLNCDAYSELIHGGFHNSLTVYWGTPTVPSITNKTTLPSRLSEAVSIADFNKDGWLDMAISSDASYGFGDSLYIFWGAVSGYSSSNYSSFSTAGGHAHNQEVADFDKDGWLDMVISNGWDGPNSIIYSPGNSPQRVDLDFPTGSNPHGTTVADFNKDGWLDIILTGKTTNESYIYWGSSTGFNISNRLILSPGYCFGGSAAADFNKDGWVDIIYFRGEGAFTPLVYLNKKISPYFSNTDILKIGTRLFSASGGIAADFNFDGNLDVFVNNFSNFSYVLYGPSYTSCDSLPCNLDSHGSFMETGNAYTREYNSYYISSVFDAGDTINKVLVHWIAYEQDSSVVKIDIRAGNTFVPDTSWSNWVETIKDSALIDSAGFGSFFQYRARFEYKNPCYLPWLEKITIELFKIAGIEASKEKCDAFNIYTERNTGSNNLKITFEIPVSGNLTLTMYNSAGEKVKDLIRNLSYPVGIYCKNFDCQEIGAGVYFYRCKLENKNFIRTKSNKIIIIR